jgi:hypothetical protein
VPTANVWCGCIHARPGAQDVGSGEAVAQVVQRCKVVVEFVCNHTVPGAIYQRFKKELKVKKGLEKPGATRFATNLRMLASVEANRCARDHAHEVHNPALSSAQPLMSQLHV